MKKILIVDTGKEFGGGTKSLLILLKNIDKNRFSILSWFKNDYLLENTKISKIIEDTGVKFLHIPHPPFKQNKFVREFFRLFNKKYNETAKYNFNLQEAIKILNAEKPNIVHLNNHFSTNLAFIEAANILGIPVIQHLRKNSALSEFAKNKLAEFDYTTIAVSESTNNFYKNQNIKIDENVIYNPVFECDKFSNERKQNHNTSETVTILMPANYLANKGHKIIFEALKKCRRNDIKLYIAGSGVFDDKTKALKQELEALGRLVEVGFVKDINKYYEAADYIISFSEQEGLPRAVLEGIGHGCGIIASDIDVMHEIKKFLSSDVNFHIIKRNADTLYEIFEHAVRQEKKIDRAFLQKFSVAEYVRQIENIYEGIK